MQQAHFVVIPFHEFYAYVGDWGFRELGGKIVITSIAYEDRVKFLRERGVDAIIDAAPKILERVVSFSVLEAMIMTWACAWPPLPALKAN